MLQSLAVAQSFVAHLRPDFQACYFLNAFLLKSILFQLAWKQK